MFYLINDFVEYKIFILSALITRYLLSYLRANSKNFFEQAHEIHL